MLEQLSIASVVVFKAALPSVSEGGGAVVVHSISQGASVPSSRKQYFCTVTFVLVAIAGALGALCRVGIYAAVGEQRWPWVTLGINVLGSLLLGVVVTLTLNRIPAEYRIAITGGFLGAFTTFSTFAYEGAGLINEGRLLAAALYAIASIVLGVAAVFVGVFIAHRIG